LSFHVNSIFIVLLGAISPPGNFLSCSIQNSICSALIIRVAARKLAVRLGLAPEESVASTTRDLSRPCH